MSRYTTMVFDAIATICGTVVRTIVVSHPATHGLRALGFTRSLLVRLADEASARWQVALWRRQPVALAYAARAVNHAGSAARRVHRPWRPVKPRFGAGLGNS
jgi:hypothetical protein